MVNAHIHAVTVEGAADAIAGGHEAVCQSFTYHPTGIGQGQVVEIATHQDGIAPVGFNIPVDGLCLRGSQGG